MGFTELGAPTFVLLVCGFVTGAALPPTSSVLRSQWTELLEPRLHQAAFALDSTMIELIFITGPLLTAGIAAVSSPAGALIVSAVATVTGTAIFTALPPTKNFQIHERSAAGMLGALAIPGVRTLVLVSLPTGIGLGILEVGIPAFSRAEGAAAAAGVLLAMWSLGSGIGGLLYGIVPRRGGVFRMHLFVTALLPLTILPLAAAPSVTVMAFLVMPAGCCIAPLLATRNELVGGVAPPAMRTEAYTWPMTAFVGGIAIGAALAGVLVEGPGWRTAFLVAAGISATSSDHGRDVAQDRVDSGHYLTAIGPIVF